MTAATPQPDVDEPPSGVAGAPGGDGTSTPPPRWLLALVAAAFVAVLLGQLLLLPQLLDPEVPGSVFDVSNSKGLFALNAALLAVTGIAAVLLTRRRYLAVAPAFVLLGVVLAAALTVGGRLLDAVAAVLTMTAAWIIGRAITRRVATPALQDVPVVDVVIGAGVLGLGVQLLGRIDAIAWWTVGLAVVVVGAAGAVAAIRALLTGRAAIADVATSSPVATMAVAVIAIQLAWTIVYLSAPDIMFDALYGKAYLPALWADTGSIDRLIESPALNLAGLAQIIATPGHTLGSADVGRWLQDLGWLVVVGTVWAWGGARSVAGPLGAVALAITPHLLWQNSTAYDDAVLLLPAAALAIAVVRTLADDAEPATLGTAFTLGLLGGAAVWFKLHLLVLTAVLLAGWLLLAGPARGLPRRTAALVAGGVLVAGPAMTLRWIDTGNPVFPNYNALFKSRFAPAANDTFNFPFWPDAGTLGPLELPYRVVAEPSLMSEVAPPGMYGFFIAVLILALLVGWRRELGRGPVVVWTAILIATVAWWVQLRYLRYALPIGIASTLLVVAALRDWTPTRRTTVALVGAIAVGAAAFLPSAAASFWNVPEHKAPFAAAFGRWDDDDYLRTVFPERDALQAYRAAAPSGALALTDAHERVFTGDRKLTVMYETVTRLTLVPPAPQNGDQALAKLRQLGIGWAVLQSSGVSQQNYPWLRQAIADHGEIVFADRGWSVYRLVDRPSRPQADQACDAPLRGTPGCWNGVDRSPGLTPGETASRVVRVCPGTLVAVGVRAAAAGEPAQVVIDPDGTTGMRGYQNAVATPGATTWTYATVPEGAGAATVTVAPGAGGKVDRVETARLGPACPAG